MKILNQLKRIFKRQSENSLGSTSWNPSFQSSFFSGTNPASSLGTVQMALRLYSDACCTYPLKVLDSKEKQIKHYLTRVICCEPNSFQNSNVFFSNVVGDILLNGNSYIKIDYDSTGKIKALLPYIQQSCWAYPNTKAKSDRISGNFSDPLEIEKNKFFYKDFKSRVFFPDEICQIKDAVTSGFDLLNAPSRISIARINFEVGHELLESMRGLSQNGLIPPQVIAGPFSRNTDETKKFIEKLQNFFTSGQARQRRFLALPENFKAQDLSLSIKEADFRFLKNLSDLDIAKVFGVNYLFHLESSSIQSGLKEAFRAVKSLSVAPFLKNIAGQFTKSLLSEDEKDRGLHFSFDMEVASSMDLRERGTYLKSIKESGIATANEARAYIGLDEHPEGNKLESKEKEKMEIVKEQTGKKEND